MPSRNEALDNRVLRAMRESDGAFPILGIEQIVERIYKDHSTEMAILNVARSLKRLEGLRMVKFSFGQYQRLH